MWLANTQYIYVIGLDEAPCLWLAKTQHLVCGKLKHSTLYVIGLNRHSTLYVIGLDTAPCMWLA